MAKRSPRRQDGIEWPERMMSGQAKMAANGQEGSEHRTVPSGQGGAEWLGERRVVGSQAVRRASSDWQRTKSQGGLLNGSPFW